MSTPPVESSRRRRQPKPVASTEASAPEPVTTDASEKKPRPPRVETVEVPESYVGNNYVGRISDIIRVGTPKPRPMFGFINIGTNIEPIATVPRIYFKRKDYSDPVHFMPRKGYEVEFKVNKSEEGRFYATDVKLTKAGVVEADANKKKAEEAKAAKQAAPAAVEPAKEVKAENTRKERVKKPRQDGDKADTSINADVTVEGQDGVYTVKISTSRPKLSFVKREVMKHFNVEGEYSITYEGVFLTISTLKTLKDGAKLHFAKSAEKTA